MPRRSVTVDVDVYLDDFDDQDLVEELENRGYSCYEDPNKPSGDPPILSRNDLVLLRQLLDTDLKNWEHTRLRDTLTSMIS